MSEFPGNVHGSENLSLGMVTSSWQQNNGHNCETNTLGSTATQEGSCLVLWIKVENRSLSQDHIIITSQRYLEYLEEEHHAAWD